MFRISFLHIACRVGSWAAAVAFLVVLVPASAFAQEESESDSAAGGTLVEAMALEEGSWAATVDAEYALPVRRVVGDPGRVFVAHTDSGALDALKGELRNQNVENVTTVLAVPGTPMLPRRSVEAVLVSNARPESAAHERMLGAVRAALMPEGRLVLAGPAGGEEDGDREHSMQRAATEAKKAGFVVVQKEEAARAVESGEGRTWMVVAVPTAGAN